MSLSWRQKGVQRCPGEAEIYPAEGVTSVTIWTLESGSKAGGSYPGSILFLLKTSIACVPFS